MEKKKKRGGEKDCGMREKWRTYFRFKSELGVELEKRIRTRRIRIRRRIRSRKIMSGEGLDQEVLIWEKD